MTGKDCRAKGDYAEIIVATDDELMQLAIHATNGRLNRHTATPTQSNAHDTSIIGVDFDPRRDLMYWLDARQRRIFRAAIAHGNQTHAGQLLDVNFEALGLTPTALAVDYLSGNLYVAAIGDENAAAALDLHARKRRMSEPRDPDVGTILMLTNDGRYIRRIIGGNLYVPTAIVAISPLGRICYADAGISAKIECADMDGNRRKVSQKHMQTKRSAKG